MLLLTYTAFGSYFYQVNLNALDDSTRGDLLKDLDDEFAQSWEPYVYIEEFFNPETTSE